MVQKKYTEKIIQRKWAKNSGKNKLEIMEKNDREKNQKIKKKQWKKYRYWKKNIQKYCKKYR